MPSSWLTLDGNFPSFTGKESPKEQISKLSDYLFQLTDNLKYTLQNLGKDNWNTVALEQLSEDATKKLAEQFQNTLTQVQGLQNTLNGLSGRVKTAEENIADQEERLKAAEENLAFLQATPEDHETRLRQLETDAGAAQVEMENHESRLEELEQARDDTAADVDELQQAMSNISDIIQSEDGKATFGGEGKEVHLVGSVYINGVLYGGEGVE